MTGQTWTGKQLKEDILELVSSFVEAGFTKGEVVAFYCDDKYLASNAIALLAVMTSGAIYTGGDFKYPYREVLTLIDDSGASYIIASESTLEMAIKVAKELPRVKKVWVIDPPSDHLVGESIFALPRSAIRQPLPKVIPKDIAVIGFSSGTTGKPKAVLRDHRGCVAFKAIAEWPSDMSTENSTMLVSAPFYHMSDVNLMLNSLFAGSKIVLHTYAERCFPFAAKYKCTSAFFVPSEVSHYAKHDLDVDTPLVLEDLFIAGSTFSKVICGIFAKKYNVKHCRNSYGSTEMGWQTIPPKFMDVCLKCSGIPTAGSSFKIIDSETGQKLGPNQVGEIYATGPQLAVGYLNNEKANRESFDKDGFFATGDGGYYDKDGMLFVTDRFKEIIKCEGIQVSPSELESLLVNHPAVLEAAVIGFVDEEKGESPKAFVVRAPGAQVSEQELVDYIAQQVAPYKQLRQGVEFLDAFPRTLIGKIDRKELRARQQKSKIMH